jgi:lysozyme
MSRLTASRAAFDLIASFEGFRTRAVQAPDGQWTLGFGHTATAREGLSVTRAEAEDLLRWDLLPIEDTLRQVALTPLSQNQFDALVSFAFNIGLENFKGCDVLKYLNQGQPIAAALSLHAWRRAPVNGRILTIDALVRRRAAESAMFLETIGARPAAPTSIVRPQADQGALVSPLLNEVVTIGEPKAAQRLEAVASPDVAPEPVPVPVPVPVPTPVPVPEQVPAPAPLKPTVQKSVAESIPQDVVKEGPVVLPALEIPPVKDFDDAKSATSPYLPPMPNTGPVAPKGLSPFPGTQDYAPANGVTNTLTSAANDGHNTRLHATPEQVDTPDATNAAPTKVARAEVDGANLLTWALMALGAALLAFGLFYSWKSGLLTVASPRREPSVNELTSLLAAASGFIMLVTSAVAAITRDRDQS